MRLFLHLSDRLIDTSVNPDRLSLQQTSAGMYRSRNWLMLAISLLIGLSAYSQDGSSTKQSSDREDESALKVNWLYGSFVPRNVPLDPLTPHQRWKLYQRMTYTTWGIYLKTGLFTMSDQIRNVPPEWQQSPEGFAKRLGSRQAQFVIQNSLTALGDAAVGWEIRYDRCHCDGFWPRTWHAIARNFVTYSGTEKSLRPQIMPYAAAFGGAVTAASWQPGNPNLLVKGYQGAITQLGVGIGVNWLAEFAPEIKRILHRDKHESLER